MFLLSLVSLTLFVVPIFLTFGAFFAVEHEKILDCGFHCGTPGGGGFSGTPFPGAPGGDVTGEVYCQLSYGITPDPGDYIFNPNQWGKLKGAKNYRCATLKTSTNYARSNR